MMNRVIVLSAVIVISAFNLSAQEVRMKIKDYVNTEIHLDNGWAGESITLFREKGDYFILRKVFGSGVPVAGKFRYAVTFMSDYQIEFTRIIEPKELNVEFPLDEQFRMNSENDGIAVYLNGLKLVTKTEEQPNKTD